MSAASLFSPVFSAIYRVFARLSSPNFTSFLLRCSNFQTIRGRIGGKMRLLDFKVFFDKATFSVKMFPPISINLSFVFLSKVIIEFTLYFTNPTFHHRSFEILLVRLPFGRSPQNARFSNPLSGAQHIRPYTIQSPIFPVRAAPYAFWR